MDEAERRASAAGQMSVLLEEYRALRAEVTQRIGSASSLVGFVGAAAAFAVSSRAGGVTWIAVALVGTVLIAVWVSSLLALRTLGKRLRELEAEINACARAAYELDDAARLLGWDTLLAQSGGWMRRVSRRIGLD